MNKQGKVKNGKVDGGIEWVKTINADGTQSQGFTWNPVRGCRHACKWTMPDGTVAICYAENIATNVAKDAYPHGFEHHYWNPHVLDEPLKVQQPSRIFLDSMSDLMGKWVPTEQIEAVLDVCRRAHWHTFQLLTKNAPRLEEFDFPQNVWVGVSAPPTSMFGHALNLDQQKRLVDRQIKALANVRGAGVRWMSIEPLSFDIAPLLVDAPLDWVVIGAATNGFKAYQPEREWVEGVLALMDSKKIPVFFKGNLKWSPWREEFPAPRLPEVTDAPIVISASPTPPREHTGVMISGRFLMLVWLHESKSAEIGVMRDTVTGDERWTMGDTAKPHTHPLKILKTAQAQELIANGEWSPVDVQVINGKVKRNVHTTETN